MSYRLAIAFFVFLVVAFREPTALALVIPFVISAAISATRPRAVRR